jgi:hypothetical protein
MDTRYLLLTGKRRSGHLRTTVSVFTTAAEADAEFGRRRKRLAAGGWLELVSIDDQGRITPVSRSGGQPGAHAATRRSAGVGSAPM